MTTHDDKRRRRLAMAAETPGELLRHPDDGFQMAEPYPMGAASVRMVRGQVLAMIPLAPAPAEPDLVDRIVAHVRVMMQYMPRLTARGFLLTMWLLELAPLWRFQALGRLSRLPRAKAHAVLRGLAASRLLPLRLLMLGPQGLILSTYFDQDVVHRRLDYEPRGFTRERIALRQKLEAGEAAASSDHLPAPPQLSPTAEPEPQAATPSQELAS
jgi:hypothetical protein